MDYTFTFTPATFIGGLLAICAAITCISSAISVLVGGMRKAQEPDKIQNERIDGLESEIRAIKRMLTNDDSRIHNLEIGTQVTMQALLALLSHGIDGNDIESMKVAKAELQKYLINKKS